MNGKLDVLSKLDDELIELIDEEHLDAEVEQADLMKENISLAVISIEEPSKLHPSYHTSVAFERSLATHSA